MSKSQWLYPLDFCKSALCENCGKKSFGYFLKTRGNWPSYGWIPLCRDCEGNPLDEITKEYLEIMKT